MASAVCASIILIGAHCFAQTAIELRPDNPITGTISDGQIHRYRSAIAGEVLITVENLERGMLLTACRIDCSQPGSRLARTANWRGPEHLHTAVLTADSLTVIELTPDTAVGPTGDYRISLQTISPSDPVYAAEMAMTRGAELHAAYWWDGADSLSEASEQFSIAAEGFERAGNDARTADALFELANVHFDLDNFARAYDAFLEAEQIWTGRNDQRGVAAARNHRGLIQWHFGDALTDTRTEPGIVLFESVIALRAGSDQSYFRAQALNNLGLIYQQQGRSRLALQYFRDALETGSGDVDLMAIDPTTFDFSSLQNGPWLDDALTWIMNIGWAFDRAANPPQAVRHYEQALKLTDFLDTPRLAAEIRTNHGALNYRMGRFEPALEQLQAALSYFRDVSRDEVWEAQVHNDLGLVYFANGDSQLALVELNEALRLRTAARHPIDRAQTLRNLALIDLEFDRPAAALSRLNDAFALLPVEQEEVRLNLADLHSLAGRIYLATGDIEVSLEHHEDALRLLDGQAGYGRAMADHAWALHIAGRDTAAIAELRVALQIAEETDSIPDLVRGNTYLAQIYASHNDFERAVSHAAQAVSVSNEIRAQIRHPALLSEFSAVQQDAYDVLLSANIELQNYESAWVLADGTRARRFRELLRRTGADLELLSNAEKIRFDELSVRVAELGQQRTEFLANGRTAEAEDIRLELLPLTVELESLRLKAGEHTAFAGLEFAAADVQAMLDEGDALLEFHFAENWAGLWVVSPTRVSYHPLPEADAVRNLADQIRGSLGPLTPDPDTALQELSTLLFARAGVSIEGAKRLIVVPDGPMHFVPMAILRDPASGFDEPLISRREIVYAPSASAVLALEERSPERGRGIAILADPVFEPNDERIRTVAATRDLQQVARLDPDLTASTAYNSRSGFARLYYTAIEAEAIREAAGDRNVLVATGTEANRDFVLDGSLNEFRILHFATHGILDIEEPSSSGLVLSGLTAQGEPRQRYLRTGDIVNLKLNADLVVLSGCDTGLGRTVRGEGLQSLSRAFFHAGARSVVSSLWQVPDAATSALMSAFYTELLTNGRTLSQALRLAQLQIRANPLWEDPYFWAAFVLQGTWTDEEPPAPRA